MQLAGQVALVTGGASGIGAACVAALAAEGARVAVADLNTAGAEETAAAVRAGGGDAVAITVDMASVESVRAMVAAAVEWGGTLDALVNNAGIDIAKPLLEYTEQEWQLQQAVNVQGPFFALQAAARIMLGQGGGRIVNIVSTSGFVASSSPAVAYDVSKGAMRLLTISAAAELAPHGVAVNGVAPGTVATALTRAVLDTPEKMARASAKIPVGRLAEPSEIASAVVYLCSPAASYLCGHVLVVDGGWLLY
jgi:NAD(P)-dependent dehydrogenase (short-subunit alcohol dehydrogenase family)